MALKKTALRKTKPFLFLILLPALLSACLSSNRRGIETSLAWSQMSSLPESATDLELVEAGSIFTREITLTFHASEEDIKNWLKDSPGTQRIGLKGAEGIQTYKIEPAGAQFAQVTVNWTALTVTIRTYWS